MVLPADVDDREVAEVDLVLADQVEQQVERALELRQVHRVGLDELRAEDRDPDAFRHGSLRRRPPRAASGSPSGEAIGRHQRSFMASETPCIVSVARARAFAPRPRAPRAQTPAWR